MTNYVADTASRKAARIAGLGYLGMFFPAIFAQLVVFQGLVVPGDAGTTANNIQSNELLFRFGIAGWLVVLVFDLVVAWALYLFLKPAGRNMSLLVACFRLVYTAIHGAALLNLVLVLALLRDDGYPRVFEASQMHALALLFLDGRNSGFLVGLVFFGFHLLLLGALAFRSGYVPRTLGVLLALAGLGYLADSFAHILLLTYADYAAIFTLVVAVPSTVAELSLGLWLLLSGARVRSGQPRRSEAF